MRRIFDYTMPMPHCVKHIMPVYYFFPSAIRSGHCLMGLWIHYRKQMDPIIQSYSPSQSYGQFFSSSCSPLQINLNEATSSTASSLYAHTAAHPLLLKAKTLKAFQIKLRSTIPQTPPPRSHRAPGTYPSWVNTATKHSIRVGKPTSPH